MNPRPVRFHGIDVGLVCSGRAPQLPFLLERSCCCQTRSAVTRTLSAGAAAATREPNQRITHTNTTTLYTDSTFCIFLKIGSKVCLFWKKRIAISNKFIHSLTHSLTHKHTQYVFSVVSAPHVKVYSHGKQPQIYNFQSTHNYLHYFVKAIFNLVFLCRWIELLCNVFLFFCFVFPLVQDIWFMIV